MSRDIFECSVKHNTFNECQKRLQDAHARIPALASSFSDVVKGQDDSSMKNQFAVLSRNNQHILHDIVRSDRILAAIDEYYRDISDANSVSSDVWKQGTDIKIKFDEMHAQYDEGRDGMLQRAEHMKISYDQLVLLIKDSDSVSAEDFDVVHQDLKASTLDA
ncbi:MAG: hypothetical protein COB36_08860 [Alphaproteobacteria bacterium]|nr:MAG: hypothetical protein COB36_08860 [Alphaproteobacteria bacterium]